MSVEALERAEAMAWKALLLGAKMVRSDVESTVSARFSVVRAPTRAVRLNSVAVSAMSSGGERTVSIMWIMPLL